MTVTRIDASLDGYEIGFSGAVPELNEWIEPAMDRSILEFVSLLSGLIFKYGGRVVHGSHPSFTPIILRQARRHAKGRERRAVTLLMSELFFDTYKEAEIAAFSDVAELIVTKKVGAGGPEDSETRNASLTAMRQVLASRQNIMVAVGGKLHTSDGLRPGVEEEMRIAEERQIPRYLVGGLGGFSAKMTESLSPLALRNGLTQEVNELLYHSRDVSSCVAAIFEDFCQPSWNDTRSRPKKIDYSKESFLGGELIVQVI